MMLAMKKLSSPLLLLRPSSTLAAVSSSLSSGCRRPLSSWRGGRGKYAEPSEEELRPLAEKMALESWVVSLGGRRRGIVRLDADVFGQDVRGDVVHRVVHWQRAKRRRGQARVKDRGQISGSGKKPWQQKGTGRARAGTRRGPLWRGGSKAHGPVPRSFAYTLPKKVRNLGLKIALSAKQKEGNLIVLDNTHVESPKTRDLYAMLDRMGVVGDPTRRTLVIEADEPDANFAMASRNIRNVDVLPVRGANVYDIVRSHTLIVTLDAIEGLRDRLAGLWRLASAEDFELTEEELQEFEEWRAEFEANLEAKQQEVDDEIEIEQERSTPKA